MADLDIERRDLPLTFGLAFLGGYCDATGLILAKTFTGHLTGNLVLVAVSVATRDWSASLGNLSAIAAFLMGIFLSAMIARLLKTWTSVDLLPLVMAVELALISAASLVLASSLPARVEIFVATVALALGLQNGAFQRAGGVSVHTTYLTGTITRLITAGAGKLEARAGDQPGAAGTPETSILGGIWMSFVMGALAGAAMTLRLKGFGLLGAAALLIVLIVRTFVTGFRSRHSN